MAKRDPDHYFLGLDFGTSGARGAVIDAKGDLLWQGGVSYNAGPEFDWINTWRQALFEVLGAIPTVYKSRLQAIAIDGTSSTVMLLDAGGNSLTEPILYNDDRGKTVQDLLAKLAPGNHGVHSATSSLAKLLWWSQRPEFSHARYFCHQADWLGFLLHGRLGMSDYHNALKLGYDVERFTYPPWLQDQAWFNLLPQITAPGTIIKPLLSDIAEKFQLPPNCWVCSGTTDSIAAFLASGASQPGEAVTSLGSTLVLKLLSETPVTDVASGVYSHRLGNLWLTGGASNAGGAVLKQFFTPAELVRLSQAIDPHQPSPLDYYPLLTPGERFPINDPHHQPRLTPRPQDDRDFLHGLLAGLSRIEALGYQKLQQLGATPVKRILTAGGGAKNLTWQTMRERLMGVPVTPSPQSEAAYGAARLAHQGFEQQIGTT
ncbi:MAG: FGGY-family carbohydrate kinase [Synechocystis sp.]